MSNEHPTFSVVIPHYNAPEMLNPTLDTVVAQTLAASEIIVVDDQSPETGRPVLTDVQQNAGVRIIVRDKNCGGPAGPRNTGVEHSSADYVAFLDADDLWAPDHLQTLADEIQASDATVVGTTIRNFSNSESLPTLVSDPSRRVVSAQEVLMKSPFATSATAVRRSLFSEFSFNESPDYRAVEDIDLWQRIVLCGQKAAKLRKETVWYRLNPAGISANKARHLRKIFRVIRANGALLDSGSPAFLQMLNSYARLGVYCAKSFYLRRVCARL